MELFQFLELDLTILRIPTEFFKVLILIILTFPIGIIPVLRIDFKNEKFHCTHSQNYS